MQRTIKHIIETLSNINTFPQLTIDAYHSGRAIAMIPSEDEIFNNFHRILDTVSSLVVVYETIVSDVPTRKPVLYNVMIMNYEPIL